MLAQYVVMRQAVAAGQRTRKDDQRSISRGDKQDIANAKTGKHAWSSFVQRHVQVLSRSRRGKS